jgi:excisionase family DNA binding protein
MKKNKSVSSENLLFFDNKILRVEQVAEMLQFSKWHIYRLVNQDKIPFYKKGKTLFFMSAEILEWLQEKESA